MKDQNNYLAPWRNQIVSAVLRGMPVSQVAEDMWKDIKPTLSRSYFSDDHGKRAIAAMMRKLLRANRIDYYSITRKYVCNNPRREYAIELRKRGYTLTEIGLRLGVSRQRASQLARAA